MAMTLDEAQMLALFRSMDTNLQQLARSSGAGGGGGDGGLGRSGSDAIDRAEADKYERSLRAGTRNLSGQNRAQSYLTKSTQRLTSMTNKELKERSKGKNALKAFNLALDKSSSYLSEAAVEYNKLVGRSIPEQMSAFRNLVQGTNGLTSTLAKAQRESSLLGASLLKSHSEISENSLEYATYMRDLGKAAGTLDEVFLRRAGIIDETSKEIRDSLRAEDFSQLRLSLGEAQVAINEGVSHLGLGSFNELAGDTAKLEAALNKADTDITGGGSAVRDALIATAARLEKQGFDTGMKILNASGQMDADSVAKLGSTDYVALAQAIAKLNEQIGTSSAALDSEATARNTTIGAMNRQFRTLDGQLDFLGRKLGELASTAAILGSLRSAGNNALAAFQDIADFNIASIPATFLDVQKASVKMGMSFQDTVKFMQENKRVVALYGNDAFRGMMTTNKDIFAKFGYTMKQAGELVGPAVEAGISSGLNVRSGEALNNYIDDSMKAFKSVAGIVNLTAGEYFKLNTELFSAQEIQGTLLGMDSKRALAETKNLEALRNNYIAQGLSAEAANALVKAQKAVGRDPVKDRIRDAAKIGMLAQQMGMSGAEGNRIQQLAMKGNLNADEQAEMTALTTKLARAKEEKRVDAYDRGLGSGFALDAVSEALSPGGSIGKLLADSSQLVVAERAQIGLTDAERAKTTVAAAGSENVASVGNALNSATSLIENNFMKTIWGLGAAFVGLAAQSAWLMKTFMGLNGAAGGKGILGAAGKALGGAGKGVIKGAGKAAGIAGKVGASALKKIPLVGLAAGLGFGASRAWDGDWTGAGMEVASGAASTIPGLGTAASIGIDGALIARDIVKENKISTSSPATHIPISVGQPGTGAVVGEINKTAQADGEKPTDTLSVSDSAAQGQLQRIATSLIEAVELLRIMSEQGDESLLSNKNRLPSARLTQSRQIPSTYQFVTGRGQ